MEHARNCTVSPIKTNSTTLWNPTCSLLSSANSNSYHCQQPLNKIVLWLFCAYPWFNKKDGEHLWATSTGYFFRSRRCELESPQASETQVFCFVQESPCLEIVSASFLKLFWGILASHDNFKPALCSVPIFPIPSFQSQQVALPSCFCQLLQDIWSLTF